LRVKLQGSGEIGGTFVFLYKNKNTNVHHRLELMKKIIEYTTTTLISSQLFLVVNYYNFYIFFMLAMILDLENQHSFDLHHQDGRHLTANLRLYITVVCNASKY